jgi:hypothetical protein
MAATVTDNLRKNISTLFLDQVNNSTDSDFYYIGIGKSDPYNSSDTTINPVRTIQEERALRGNLQSVKKVEAASLVIPRYNWSQGSIFSAFSDSLIGIPNNSYYVLTQNNEVYICLKQATNNNNAAQTSTVEPNYSTEGVAQTSAFETSDGYVWKYMYELTAARSASFLSTNWMPIEFVDSADQATNAATQAQYNVQDTATNGQIVGVEVTAGGSGYTSAPTVAFIGNGTSAAATATVVSGVVTKIEMNNATTAFGSGYDYAEVTLTGGSGTGATARPIIGPVGGIGSNATIDLKSSNTMLNIRPDGKVADTFPVDNEFRQIGIFKNIKQSDSADPGIKFQLTSGYGMRALELSSVAEAGTFTNNVGKLMSDNSTPAVSAFVDYVDSNYVYYHQNDSSGFGAFTTTKTITGVASGSGTVDALIASTVNPFSGDLLYVENRSAILRDEDQKEDIKVIITV